MAKQRARRKTVRLSNGQFEGLDLAPGGTFDDVKSLVAAARRIARDEGLDWRVVPYGAESASRRSRARRFRRATCVSCRRPARASVPRAPGSSLIRCRSGATSARRSRRSCCRPKARIVRRANAQGRCRRGNALRVQRRIPLGDRRELRAGGLGGAARGRHRGQAPGRRHSHRPPGHRHPAARRAPELESRPPLRIRLRRRRCGSDRSRSDPAIRGTARAPPA